MVPAWQGDQRQVPVVQELELLLREHRSVRAAGSGNGAARCAPTAAAVGAASCRSAAVGAAAVRRTPSAGTRDEGARHRPRHRRADRLSSDAHDRGRGLGIKQTAEERQRSRRDARVASEPAITYGNVGDGGSGCAARRQASRDRESNNTGEGGNASSCSGSGSSGTDDLRRCLHVRRRLVRVLRSRVLLSPRRDSLGRREDHRVCVAHPSTIDTFALASAFTCSHALPLRKTFVGFVGSS
ncbi:MAG: hypothetical protein JWO86_8165 [Myxococcaceae bacterium]|nr:hypothetical protein [Myxococcaceae bacterium]